ncbi:MAG: NADH-quinone oxidoreductase subunit L [Chloroflexi bacterium]|nr:MAG: NADH-quinone oxidoreductase subunit L [Chloroflexota bacterium]
METVQFFNLVPWVVFLPLIGLTVNLLVGRKLGEIFAGSFASLATGLAFVVSILLAVSLSSHPEAVTIPLGDWITIGTLTVRWAFRVDTLSVVMMLVVSGVGTLIHIYSIGYMHNDVRHNGDTGRYARFFIFLNLFIAAMMILVSADNFLMMFVGWEGVGLCSYLLIGFWFEKGKNGTGNAEAAKKAFITNRIGDFGLLIAMFLIFVNFGTFQFDEVFKQAGQVAAVKPGVMLLITLFMLLGVTGKSAQLPLYVWLPDAMAGPTPVSALIHAATMVTAGVYLVARSSIFYALVPTAQTVVMWVGAATALFAATIALGQYDIKKVLAYSTISQLGFMVAAVGMGATVAGMFHLVTHAFFKGLLFLAAGSVIQGVERGMHHANHASHDFDPQDMRQMGGLRKQTPLTFRVYLIGALALSGIAPLAGFFSKDEILVSAWQTQPAIFIVLVLAAFLTAFYMGRQLTMVFFGEPRTEAAEKASESPLVVTLPLMILALLSVLGGVLNLPGVHTLETWLSHTLGEGEPGHFVWVVAGISLVLALIGLGLAWMIYSRKTDKAYVDPLKRALGSLFTGMENKWWVDELYAAIILNPYRAFAQFMADPVDLGVIDRIGGGLAAGTRALAESIRKLQNGYIRSYALLMLLGLAAIMTYLFLR